MTSHTSNKFKKVSENHSEAGVTLMLAVLILSAITAIVFSLSAIVIIEIRSAGDNLRTEPALYATLGVTEEALLQYRRNVPENIMDVTHCTTPVQGICSINSVSLTPTRLTEEDNPLVKVLRPNERTVVPMYLPQDFNLQYSRINFTVLQTRTNGQLDITVRETTYNNSVNNTTLRLDEFITPTWSFTAFNDQSQYEVILNNTGNLNPVTVSMETFGPNGQPKGIPFIDQKVLRVLADYLGLTRTYLVRIPDL